MAAPQLSVIVATTHPWPFLQRNLEILLPQCLAAGAELLVADSTGQGLPDPLPPSFRAIRHIVMPRTSVFDLRAKATQKAVGEIIAWTEDHCHPARNWCEQIYSAHASHPDAEIIGGAVLNGSQERCMDWANFLCTFGPFVPPFHGKQIPRVPVAANLSLKRRVVPEGTIHPGFVEFVSEVRSFAERRVRFDDRIIVTHVQSMGFLGTPAAHFHNGRSTTGLVAASMPFGERFFRMLVCLILPAEILRTAVIPLLERRTVRVLRHIPLMATLAVAHSAGEFAGLLLKGPGRSPLHLE